MKWHAQISTSCPFAVEKPLRASRLPSARLDKVLRFIGLCLALVCALGARAETVLIIPFFHTR